ncbi:MAG: S8 family peptidase [Candidatus Marinimicrobia bacterium]|nr:S8 family peptidase [Candidatus Neomarinimicrobiota bacterium]
MTKSAKSLFLITLLFMLLIAALGSDKSIFNYIQKDIYRPQSNAITQISLHKFSGNDQNSVTVWLFFTDKGFSNEVILNSEIEKLKLNRTPESLKNRLKSNNPIDFTDLPVYEPYVEQISEYAIKIRHKSRWFNAVSIEIRVSALPSVSSFPFISRIEPVRIHKISYPPNTQMKNFNLNKSASCNELDYGNSFGQLDQINVVAAHNSGYTGKGVLIAMFDTGFRVSHGSFSHIVNSGRLIAQHDFVNNDDIVSDENTERAQGHGTSTWSAVGGFRNGIHIGAAFGASFILAKTEDVRSETKAEEDNWIAAAEWVESLGADIISSSLAYLDFDGTEDDYSIDDLDGNTILITLAADLAVSKGINVVTAMGNEGLGPTSLWAPADGHDVISVGAVTQSGLLAKFSSRGPTIDGRIKPDVVAQGVGTAIANSFSDSSYGFSNGTSLSTPLVAGAVALLLEARPDLSPDEVKSELRSTADNSLAPNNDVGWGLIDLKAPLNISGITECDSATVAELDIISVYPNPSTTGYTKLLFKIEEKIKYVDGVNYKFFIYDLLGRKISFLDEGFALPGIQPQLNWDHKDEFGKRVSSGIYVAVLSINGKRVTKKFAVLH